MTMTSEEKQLFINPIYTRAASFIQNNVEVDSKALFLNFQYYYNIKTDFDGIYEMYFYNYFNDIWLFDFVKSEFIDYIFIIVTPRHLKYQESVKEIIYYSHLLYLLKIDKEKL